MFELAYPSRAWLATHHPFVCLDRVAADNGINSGERATTPRDSGADAGDGAAGRPGMIGRPGRAARDVREWTTGAVRVAQAPVDVRVQASHDQSLS